ncbi:MAG: hypothetical protein AB7F78_09500 [Hyphomicrobiaceae bacterium]
MILIDAPSYGLRGPAACCILAGWPRLSLRRSALQAARAAGMVAMICVAVAAAYLVKSSLGINLLPGPSPLHDMLYPLLTRHWL